MGLARRRRRSSSRRSVRRSGRRSSKMASEEAFTPPPKYPPPLELKGSTVLITGASAGFGLHLAWRYAELGCTLVLVARRLQRLQALAAALQTAYPGIKVHVVGLDVRDIAACERIVNDLPDDFKQVDILINNAGLALGLNSAADNSIEDMRTMLETNVLSVMAISKACLQGMKGRNKGTIVNVGSTAGHGAYPGGSGYCASKHALHAFTDAMRADLISTNIRVALISPGAVTDTEFSLVRFGGDAGRAAKVYEGMQPLVAADIADQIVWITTRPSHVQINDVITTCVNQSGAHFIARPGLAK